MRKGVLPTIATMLALLVPSLASAQESGENPQKSTAAYRVGPGDVLEVKVYDDPDLGGVFTVQYDGNISFPLLGDVPIDELTVREIRTKLVELLQKDFLVDPQVVVRVKDFRSKWVTLVGEVARPGKYYLQGPKNLLDLLTEAGGFTSRASGELIISRLADSNPRIFMTEDNGHEGDATIRVFLTPGQSVADQKEALSLQMHSGDILTATPTKFFYISGEVKSPGSYPVHAGLTVLKAVSLAGGLTKFGSKGKVEILRQRSDGGAERIKVDLGDIERGKNPDVPLEAEDIIKVGKRVF